MYKTSEQPVLQWCKLQSSSCVSRIPRQSTIVLFWFALYGDPAQPTSGRSLTTLTKFYTILTTYHRPMDNFEQLSTLLSSIFTMLKMNHQIVKSSNENKLWCSVVETWIKIPILWKHFSITEILWRTFWRNICGSMLLFTWPSADFVPGLLCTDHLHPRY